jgi:hypothetical protein
MCRVEDYSDSHPTVNSEGAGHGRARTHPMAQLLPMLPRESYKLLKTDIRRHGLRVPIMVTADGLILDGRNREQACRELGIECPRIVFDDTRPESLFAYVISMNVYRRHLSQEQIVAWFERIQRDHQNLAKQILDVEKVKAAAARNGNLKRGQSRQRNVAPSGKTAKAKAEALKVSERTVQTIERVAREAPEQLERVERGEISAAKALRTITATEEPRSSQAGADGTPTAGLSGTATGLLSCLDPLTTLARQQVDELGRPRAEVVSEIQTLIVKLRQLARDIRRGHRDPSPHKESQP